MVDSVIKGIILTLSYISAGLLYLISVVCIIVFGVIFVIKRNDLTNLLKRTAVLSVRFLFLLSADLTVFLLDRKYTWQDKGALLIFLTAEYLIFLLLGLMGRGETKNSISPTQFVKAIDENNQKKFEENAPPIIKDDVNFTHVLNVIEKLNYFNLTREERIQTNELKRRCLDYASGKEDMPTKREISDKLSVLLKIMAKYNV